MSILLKTTSILLLFFVFQNCGRFGADSTFSQMSSSLDVQASFKDVQKLNLSVKKIDADHLGELDLIRYIAYCAESLPLTYVVENDRRQKVMSSTTFSNRSPREINDLINRGVAVNFENVYIQGDADFFLCFDHNNNNSCRDEKITDLNKLINTSELGEFAVLFAREVNGIGLHPFYKNYFSESCARNASFFEKVKSEGLVIFHSQLADIKRQNIALNSNISQNLRSNFSEVDPDDIVNQGDGGINGGNNADGGINGGNNADGGNRIETYLGDNPEGQNTVGALLENDPYGQLEGLGITTDSNTGESTVVSRGLRFNLTGLADSNISYDENMPPPRVTVSVNSVETCQLRGDKEVCSIVHKRTNGCFVSGTKIKTSPNTYIAIEFLKKGDSVALLDGRKKIINKVVVGLEKNKIIHIEVASGKSVKVTEKHPMWTTQGYKLAKDLTLKDQLLIENGKPIALKSIKKENYKYHVFNFELEGGQDEDHVVIANGIASGDLYIQQKMAKKTRVFQALVGK